MRSLRFTLLMLFAVSFTHVAFAQEDDLESVLTGGVDDAEKLLRAYTQPVINAVSLSLNQGWYNTAKPHKIAGVDLTITVNAMAIPQSERLFRPQDLNLEEVELDPSTETFPESPTMAGPDVTPTFRLKDDPTETFEGPPGIDFKKNLRTDRLPVPMVHLGFGLPKGTDVKIRYAPPIDLSDATLKFWGIGVMHDFKQWIPGMKLLPFDMSAFVGHTRFEVESQLDPGDPANADQKGIFSINATTIQVLASKKVSVLTGYVGLGYNIARSNVALKGRYDINGDGDETDTREVDPLSLDFSASGPRATIGARLKLAVFTFHADYTLQKYNSLTVGFGIAVR